MVLKYVTKILQKQNDHDNQHYAIYFLEIRVNNTESYQ